MPPTPSETDSVIRCQISDSFQSWMASSGGSFMVTTYQAGKLAVIGWDAAAQQVSLLMRQFQKPMGLAPAVGAGGRRVALATRHEVVLLADAPLLARDYLEPQRGRYDGLFLPRAGYYTGDLNVHDLAFDAQGRLWLVNTRFGCLSWLSDEFSFVPKWKPPFVSEVVPEDRCHLNGLAMVDGKPGYVTALGETDRAGAWRDNKAAGGLVVHVDSGHVALRGLSMPHSPRWHGGALWLLNSGAGELWRTDPARRTHEVVCALPGYLRGLCFVPPHFAVVGMCQVREKHIFGGLPVQDRHERLLCGLAVIDLRDGSHVATFEFTSGCQ